MIRNLLQRTARSLSASAGSPAAFAPRAFTSTSTSTSTGAIAAATPAPGGARLAAAATAGALGALGGAALYSSSAPHCAGAEATDMGKAPGGGGGGGGGDDNDAAGAAKRRTLYPPLEPYRVGRLRVSDVHELHFEESGNPDGTPVVFVHGGPGGATTANYRRFFDPAKYRISMCSLARD